MYGVLKYSTLEMYSTRVQIHKYSVILILYSSITAVQVLLLVLPTSK
jgi:hypothetical protein